MNYQKTSKVKNYWFIRYYNPIAILICFFLIDSMICTASTSKITLTIAGGGDQPILNDLFYTEPSNVLVNDESKDDCKKTCNLSSGKINTIILEFSGEINLCENMFNNLTNITTIDLSEFDASKVTSMKAMFQDCANLTSINFGSINTSSVKYMSYLFLNCIKLNPIDVSSLDTSSVTRMSFMFRSCESLTSLNASNFNTSNVEQMDDMFSYCRMLYVVDTSSFYTPKVWNFQGMFYFCEKLKFLDLHNFVGSSVTNFQFVFGYLLAVNYINLRNFKIPEENNVLLFETYISLNKKAEICIRDSSSQQKVLKEIEYSSSKKKIRQKI